MKVFSISAYQKRGFSIMEALLAASILIFVVGCGAAVYLMSLTAWKEGSTQISLQREANSAMEKMARGVNGKDGIREAKSVTIVSGYNIQYTSAIDSVQRSFYLSSGKIIYDPSTSVPDNEYTIAENVRTNGLLFSLSTDSKIVTINLGMGAQVRDKNIYVDLATKVQLRNK